jgi:hypothetical protein
LEPPSHSSCILEYISPQRLVKCDVALSEA